MGDDKKQKKKDTSETEKVKSNLNKKDAEGVETMHVKVHGPYKIYYDGPAESISAENLTGPFDILPKHHNFMTLVSSCDIIIRLGEKEDKIPVDRGVMHVKADEVVVFLDV